MILNDMYIYIIYDIISDTISDAISDAISVEDGQSMSK